MFITEAFAQTPGGAGGGDIIMSILPFLLIFVIMYFLIIRPQRTQMKKREEMLKNVRRGDQVVTGGGFIGKLADFGHGFTRNNNTRHVGRTFWQRHFMLCQTVSVSGNSSQYRYTIGIRRMEPCQKVSMDHGWDGRCEDADRASARHRSIPERQRLVHNMGPLSCTRPICTSRGSRRSSKSAEIGVLCESWRNL